MEEIEQEQIEIEENNIKSNTKTKEKKGEEKAQGNSEPITISRKIRWITFIIIVTVSIIMGLDQGVLSSTTSYLTEDFNMTERELGGFGGMVFLGTALGCVFSFTLINKFNRKYLLLVTMCLDVLCLFFTTQTTNLILLYLCRTISGFTQSFLSIYLPVWSDQFGVHKYKSIMLSIIHLSSSLGYLLGYVLGILMGWENSFILENICIIIHILAIAIFLSDKYFSMTLMPLKAKFALINEEEKNHKEESIDKEDKVLYNDIKKIDINLSDNNEKLIDKDENNEENDEEKKDEKNGEKNNEEENEEKKKEEDEVSLFEDIKDKDEKKESILSHVKILAKSPIFILMNIALASLFIIVSAIQFWISDYLENVLLIEDEKTRLYAFAIMVITSPVAGILLGGILSGKVGGYDTEKAIYIPLFASLGVSIMANIVPLANNIYTFGVLFWIYLFLGSILIPVANGIIIVSVEKKYAGSASSVSILLYNVLGRLPGPNLYAFFKSLFEDKSSNVPFRLLLNVAIIGFLSILICVKFQKIKYKKLRESLKKEKEEEEKIIIDNNEDNKKEESKEVILEQKDKNNDNKKKDNSDDIKEDNKEDNKGKMRKRIRMK
jgi:MFS family permease